MLLNVLIIEDNEFFMNCNIKYMKQIASMYGAQIKLQCFTCIGEGVMEYVRNHKIDLALLDVEVGDQNGIVVGEELLMYQPFSSIIFITEYGKYLSRANALHPDGYLEKPIDFKQLSRLCYKIILAKVGKSKIECDQSNIITLRSNREPVDIRELEIIYIRKVNRRLLVVTKNKKMLISTTLKNTKEQLSDLFVYASRDIIINKLEVKQLEKGSVIMSNGEILPTSLRNHSELVRKIRT